MMKLHYIFIFILFLAVACEDDAKFSRTSALGFETAEGTVAEDKSIKIGFYANASYTEPVTVTVAVRNYQNLVYGTDYVMDPVPVDNTITVTLDPANEDPSVISFYPVATGELRRISFEIVAVEGGGLELAQQAALTYSLTIRPPVTGTVLASHNFNDCTTDYEMPIGFIEALEPGAKEDRGWGCRAFGVDGSRAPRASAFGGTVGEDRAWMIMDPFAVPESNSVNIRFSTFSAFGGPGVVHVKWSSDYTGSGNPLLATWHDLALLDEQFPAAGSKVWTHIEGDFSDIAGEDVYLAFQYIEGTDAESSAWDIDNLEVIAVE